MKDEDKSREQLTAELHELRQRVASFEQDKLELRAAKEAVMESELLYRTTIENISDTVIITDDQGVFVYVCPNTHFIFGLKSDEILALGNISALFGESLFDFEELNKRIEISNVEVSITDSNGREHFLLVNIKRVSIISGTILYTCRDTTERKVVEKALQEAGLYNRSLIEASLDPLATISTEGKITDVNAAAERVTGHSRRDLIGSDFADYFTDPEKAKAAYQEAFKIGSVSDYELEIRHKDGHLTPVLYNGSVYQDAHGQIAGLFAAARDITPRKRTEEALSESEHKYRTLFEESFDGLFITSPQGRILDMNKKGVEMFGYDTKREVFRLDLERDVYVHPPDRKRILSMVNAQGSAEYEVVVKKKGGEEMITHCSLSAVGDETGEITSYRGIIRDITEQKQAEQRLRESEEQYRAVFDNAGIGIKVLGQDKRIVRVNPSLSAMLGYSEAEFLELTPLDLTYPDDREMTNQYLDAILGDGPDSLRLEKRYIRKDGTVAWGDVSISSMRDTQGNRVAVLEVVADITERKESRIALQESEERMRRIIDSSPVGIRITQNGRHAYANRALAAMFSYNSQEEILDLPAEALFAPESQTMYRQRVADKMAGRTTRTHYEASGINKHGKTIALESWGTEINYLGKKSWLEFVIDVSESKSLRAQLQQAQKLEAIGTLAGGVAHDFNNILGIIMGYAEIADFDLPIDSPLKQRIAEVLKATHRAKDLVKQILTFSRKQDQERRPLRVIPVIKEALKLLRSSLPTTIEMRQNIDLLESEDLVLGDPTQIHQVLMNLSTNAAHAMRERGGILGVSLTSVDFRFLSDVKAVELRQGKYLKLTVEDTGHGMDRTTLERVFDPYFTTKGPGEGTGLGLAVVHGIVKSHNGAITVLSEPGEGATFHIYLPKLESEASPVKVASASIPTGSERILLVDDEEVLVNAVKQMLEHLGYKVTRMKSSVETLALFRQQPEEFDLVITDYTMPGMTGTDLAKEIMDIRPDLPIILCTGFSEKISEDAVKNMGIRALLMKPIALRSLAETVHSVLGKA
jgi:PAS domain S-box-containing protein